jgi:hypothetical protein
MTTFNVSVLYADGETIAGLISRTPAYLLEFLDQYDHEGAGVHMTEKRDSGEYLDFDGEDVYHRLAEEVS